MRLSVAFETYQTGLARVTYVLMCSKTFTHSVAFFWINFSTAMHQWIYIYRSLQHGRLRRRQNRTVYAVLNLKQNLRSTYCSEANDRHEASHGPFATAELLVSAPRTFILSSDWWLFIWAVRDKEQPDMLWVGPISNRTTKFVNMKSKVH